MCFVWIWEQTAIISLYSIKLTGFYNRNGVYLLRGTDWILIIKMCISFQTANTVYNRTQSDGIDPFY